MPFYDSVRLDRDLVLSFLDEAGREAQEYDPDTKRALDGGQIAFLSCGGERPGVAGNCSRILAIPLKRTHIEVARHLSRDDVDALIDATDQQPPRGRRDRPLVLFLARTGARTCRSFLSFGRLCM